MSWVHAHHCRFIVGTDHATTLPALKPPRV